KRAGENRPASGGLGEEALDGEPRGDRRHGGDHRNDGGDAGNAIEPEREAAEQDGQLLARGIRRDGARRQPDEEEEEDGGEAAQYAPAESDGEEAPLEFLGD